MHREYEDLLLLYTTNSLDDDDKRRLEAHLQACEVCRASLNEWRTIKAAVRQTANLRAASLPALRFDGLQQENELMQMAPPLPQRRTSIPLTLTAVAALLLLAGLVLFTPKLDNSVNLVLQGATAPPGIFVEIVVPSHDIDNGSVITEDDIMLVPFPVDMIPFNALTDVEDAVGKIARTNIHCGQPVMANLLAENARDVARGVAPLNEELGCTNHEPASAEFVQVVVAMQDLPQGQRIERDAVALRPLSISSILPGTTIDNLDDVVGSIANQDIYREQAITDRLLIQIPAEEIPEDKIPVAVPHEQITLINESDSALTIVDIYAPAVHEAAALSSNAIVVPGYATVAPDSLIRVIDNAQYLRSENGLMIVAVAVGDDTRLHRLIDTKLPIIIVDASLKDSQSASEQDTSITVPEGMVPVEVPMENVTAVPYGVQVGDEVAVIASLLFVDVDEQFQTLVPSTSSEAGRPQLSTQRVGSDVLVIELPAQTDDSGSITLAATPEDAVIFTWLVEADVPLTIVRAADAGIFSAGASATLEATPANP